MDNNEIVEILNCIEKHTLCRKILTNLPEWFGIDAAIESYCKEVESMYVYALQINKEKVGFVALNHHNSSTIEIHVMGVLKDYHSKGFGIKLMEHTIKYAQQNHYKLLEVKTLDATHRDLNYKKTRKFYKNIGFLPLECIPTLWGKENPCLIMVLPLK